MQRTAGAFAVINAHSKPPFFGDVAKALTVTGMHRLDAMQRAKDRPYIFTTNEGLGQAQMIWQHLARLNVDSLVVPMEYFTYSPSAYPLYNANCLPDCFEVESPGTLQIPWEQVAMISYGRVTNVTVHMKQPRTPEIDIPLDPTYRHYHHPMSRDFDISDHTTTELFDVLDIFIGYLSDDEFAARFRVRLDKFYYDYLGDRLQATSRQNFILFAQDIANYAPNLVPTDSANELLMGALNLSKFDSVAQFNEYCLWQSALARARAAGEI